jgi:hypothetical protein
MADHGDPRLVAPLAGAWLWSFCLFFIMGRAMVGLAHNSVRRMVSRRHAATEGVLPSLLLKWTASHPPHDHVIIVFDAGHACGPRRRRKFKR